MGLHPTVAAVRLAVRRAVADLDPGACVLVGCSGGADSLALLSATVFEARRAAFRVVGVTVDHGLQAGSDRRARDLAGTMRAMGADDAVVATATVGTRGGPEAAARTARYSALDRVADEQGADVLLLGHTRDDQAETVLLGLARGSGARSLAGMAPRAGRYRRPLLDLGRDDTLAACRAEGLEVWEDPHNDDPSFTRVRVRRSVLPVLERELGPGVTDALARTARLLRDDADALDELAAEALGRARAEDGGLSVGVLEPLSPAVRRRVLRRAALEAGCPATELFAVHVDATDTLVTRWHGQVGVDLPGHVRVRRTGGSIRFERNPVAG
ncbi:MAG TPA: tRNA lysidine(34) synthetase TilS [Nocardioidaceae bacterium]|nr:tRNA lysidine(34) synthetase TilS [Nocardioidaceae bacterium]